MTSSRSRRLVLGHRLILRPESRLRKKTVRVILEEILNTVPVPPAGDRQRVRQMKWILGTLALLLLGLVFQLNLLVYAMYVLLGVLLLSRFFTRDLDGNSTANLQCAGAGL